MLGFSEEAIGRLEEYIDSVFRSYTGSCQEYMVECPPPNVPYSSGDRSFTGGWVERMIIWLGQYKRLHIYYSSNSKKMCGFKCTMIEECSSRYKALTKSRPIHPKKSYLIGILRNDKKWGSIGVENFLEGI